MVLESVIDWLTEINGELCNEIMKDLLINYLDFCANVFCIYFTYSSYINMYDN